ncbi:MAG: FGGY family pentulose kinase, partial [Alphaproteobacteria bacterium]
SQVVLGADGEPVTASTTGDDARNVVMWADHRAVAEAEEITATGHRVLDHVGGTMSPEMALPKMLWLKRHLPRAWERYAFAFDLADFMAWRATGRHVVSACTMTCKWTYLNHERPGWQDDFLACIGLGDLRARARFPDVAAPIAAPVGTLDARAAEELGLPRHCIVSPGIIDAHAGGIGLLAGQPRAELDRRVAMIAGTSTCHMAASPGPRPVHGVWGPYAEAMLPGAWLNEGGQSATGALLDHVLDWHAEGRALAGDRHARMAEAVAQALAAEGPGFARGLDVLPDFHGNRSPLADPGARGVVSGLTLDSSFASLVRLYYATAVAIALGTRHVLDALDARGWRTSHVHLTGGHAASPLLRRLYADATRRSVVLPEELDSVLLGTAIVAATAAGLHPGLAGAGAAMSREGATIAPDEGFARAFDARYARLLLMHDHARALRASLPPTGG